MRLFPRFRGRSRWQSLGLPQTYHDRGWLRQCARGARHQARHCAWLSADRAGRTGAADRARRRGRFVDDLGRQCRASGFRLGAAPESGDGAALPGSDRPLLGAGRGQSHRLYPRCGGRGPVQCVSRAGQGRRLRRQLRPARDPQCRTRHVAPGNLVQRSPGTLCAGRRAGASRGIRRHLRPRALSLRGSRRVHRRAPSGAGGSPARGSSGGSASVGAVRQATANAPRCDIRRAPGQAVRHPPHRSCRSRDPGVAPSHGGQQGLSDHHRRSLHHRHGGAGSDGWALAGAGRRLRDDHGGI